jgi:hypothetical protein
MEKTIRVFKNHEEARRYNAEEMARISPTIASGWRSNFTSGTTAMIQPLKKDWLEFIESLNANHVEYLIVGAFVVAHHGRSRLTGDLDIWVRQGAENGAYTRTSRAKPRAKQSRDREGAVC